MRRQRKPATRCEKIEGVVKLKFVAARSATESFRRQFRLLLTINYCSKLPIFSPRQHLGMRAWRPSALHWAGKQLELYLPGSTVL
jgi:hypothetical protein